MDALAQRRTVRATVARSLFVTLFLLGALGTLFVPRSVFAQDATPADETSSLTGSVSADGSGTLGPVLEAAAEAFTAQAPDVEMAIELSSSGQGLTRFCADELDLGMSGRPIKAEEDAACAEAEVAYDVFEVAFDGVAVVVNPANDAVTCMKVDQLKRLWEPESTVTTFEELDAEWPADPIALHARGEDSGTYQYFTQAIVGEEGSSRDDYTVHDSHGEIADAVAADANALGVLPFPRYVEAQDELKLVEVDGGDGCVAPSPETILDGSYAPLSRTMYLYAKRASLERPEVAEFLRFYLADAVAFAEAGGLVAEAGSEAALGEKLEDAVAGESDPDGPAATAATPAAQERGRSNRT